MRPIELLDRSLSLLTLVLEEAYELSGDQRNHRNAFIARHARNVLAIGKDVALLYSLKTYAAARVAIRTMIESSICIEAARIDEKFHARKMIAENEERAKRFQYFVNQGADFQGAVEMFQSLADRFRKEHGIEGIVQLSIYKIAEIAGTKSQYRIGYFQQSEFVHATVHGLLNQERGRSLGESLLSAIHAVIETTASFIRTIESKNPNENFLNATSLLQEAVRMSEDGSMYEID